MVFETDVPANLSVRHCYPHRNGRFILMPESLSLIDTHAHIEGKEFQTDLDVIIDRAAAAGVSRVITVGTDIESSRKACELTYLHDEIYCSVGVHPHDAVRVTEKCYDIIRQLAMETPKNVAIGEIGLDFYRDRSPRDIQEIVFRRFLIMASELSLPVIIHDRDAHEPILRILREEKSRGFRGVLHCFSGDLEMARECVDLGFHLSIPGTVTFPANDQLRNVVRGIRMENLLLETDCPYLAPVPYRGKRNEPSYLKITAEKVAELKGLSLEDVARITTLNARNPFRPGLERTAGIHCIQDPKLALPEHHQPLLEPLFLLREIQRLFCQGALSQAEPRTVRKRGDVRHRRPFRL